MTPYLVSFAAFLVAWLALEAICGHRTLGTAERWLMVVPLAAFSIPLAGHIGTDAFSYGELFSRAEDFPVEPGFSLLMVAAKSAGLDYLDFMKLLAVADTLLLAAVVMRLRDPLFFLLFYLSSFYLNFQFNALRNSLALLIVAAVYVRMQRPGVLALLASTVIHYSSLATVALQRLALSRRQALAIGAVTLLSVAMAVLWLHPELLGDRLGDAFLYKGYLEQQFEGKAVYPALLLKLAVVGVLYLNSGSRFYFASYAILVLLVHVVSPVLSRISDLVLFLALLDFCMRHRLQRHRLLAIGMTLVLVLSSLLIPWNDCQSGGTDNWCITGALSDPR